AGAGRALRDLAPPLRTEDGRPRRPSLQPAAPAQGGRVDAEGDRPSPLDHRDRPHRSRGGVTPGTVGVRLRGLDALSLPLADAALPRDEMAAVGGHGTVPV